LELDLAVGIEFWEEVMPQSYSNARWKRRYLQNFKKYLEKYCKNIKQKYRLKNK